MEEDDKEGKDEEVGPNALTARSALLDFYSDKATSFASLLVASIFGLVSLLTIGRMISFTTLLEYFVLNALSISLYLVFAFAGHHTFRRFSFYADVADRLQEHGLKMYADLEKVKFQDVEKGKVENTNLYKYIGKRAGKQTQSRVHKLLRNRFTLMYLVLIILLGLLVYYPALRRIARALNLF